MASTGKALQKQDGGQLHRFACGQKVDISMGLTFQNARNQEILNAKLFYEV